MSEQRFVLDGIEFVCGFGRHGTPDRLNLWKERELVDQYVALIDRLRPERIVEIGVADGGSTALLALLARPHRLVALERDHPELPGLDHLVQERGWSAAVQVVGGVDQADGARVGEIVDDALDGRPADLVLDDASHLLGPTRRSFEALFPRLRPGGLYVIEDWNWEHTGADRLVDAIDALGPDVGGAADGQGSAGQVPLRARLTPEVVSRLSGGARQTLPDDGPYAALATGAVLSRLAVECMLARARSGSVVRSVSIDGYWVVVERGEAVLDPGSFRLADVYDDHYGQLPAPAPPGG